MIVLDASALLEALEEAFGLPQQLSFPGPDHLRRAWVLRDRISVLDGLYVALAETLGCPLVTCDRRLGRADSPCEVGTPG